MKQPIDLARRFLLLADRDILDQVVRVWAKSEIEAAPESGDSGTPLEP